MAQKILFLQYLQALVCIVFLGKMEKSSVSGTVHPATLAVPHWFLSVSAASFPFNFASALCSKGEGRSSSKEVVEKWWPSRTSDVSCPGALPAAGPGLCSMPGCYDWRPYREKSAMHLPIKSSLCWLNRQISLTILHCPSLHHFSRWFLEHFLSPWSESLVRHLISCCAYNLRS